MKPPPVPPSEKHGRRQKLLRKGGRGHSTHPPRKDWWTSSSNEMEGDSANPRATQRSASTTASTPNHSQDGRSAGNNSNSTFVNHGTFPLSLTLSLSRFCITSPHLFISLLIPAQSKLRNATRLKNKCGTCGQSMSLKGWELSSRVETEKMLSLTEKRLSSTVCRLEVF